MNGYDEIVMVVRSNYAGAGRNTGRLRSVHNQVR
jgi:hypothetical protein